MKQILTAVVFSAILLLASPLVAGATEKKPGAFEYERHIQALQYESKEILRRVAISEVCYWPTTGEPEWIELTNLSTEPVDIQGWSLLDGHSLEIVLTTTETIISPLGTVVIYLDGKDIPLAFDKAGVANIHSAKDLMGNVLGDKGGQLALYSPQKSEDFLPDQMESYVAWGRTPGSFAEEAMLAQKWGSIAAGIPGTARLTRSGVVISLQQGGSIGLIEPFKEDRFPSRYWGTFDRTEVSPGLLEVKRQVRMSPLNPEITDGRGLANINVISMESGVKYQFQVSSDKEFNQIVIDTVDENFSYRLEKPVPRATTYYWRARLIYPDGWVSAWSRMMSLTNKQPK